MAYEREPPVAWWQEPVQGQAGDSLTISNGEDFCEAVGQRLQEVNIGRLYPTKDADYVPSGPHIAAA